MALCGGNRYSFHGRSAKGRGIFHGKDVRGMVGGLGETGLPDAGKNRLEIADDRFFEVLTQVVFATGFSAAVVQNHWEAFRAAFEDFRAQQVAGFGEDRVERLLRRDSAIVRNVRKVRATVENARVCVQLAARHGSLGAYVASLAEQGEMKARRALERDFRMVGESAARVLWMRVAGAGAPGLAGDPSDESLRGVSLDARDRELL